jgi:transposase
MDMRPAFTGATLAEIPEARDKIAFDKFHVAKYLGDAVDKVRRSEHRALRQRGRSHLTGTKYLWLRNPANMKLKQRRALNARRVTTLKTARAWAIREFAMGLWHYVCRLPDRQTGTWANKGWQRWYSWAVRPVWRTCGSRLAPVKRVARTRKAHLWGILNAVVLKANNAAAESLNSRIQHAKARGRGFRNKQRFCNAIYFHLGSLDLYPAGIK